MKGNSLRQGLAIGFSSLIALAGCAVGSSADDALSSDLAGAAEQGASSNAVLPPPTETPPKEAGVVAASDGGTCAPANTCASPLDLGELAGDQGSATQTRQGVGSQWFKLLLGEDSSSSTSLKLRAELTAPAGANYDLFIHTNPWSTTATECSNVRASSTSASAEDVASLELKDYSGTNDDQVVTIEVRYVSGACDPAAKWALRLSGNRL